VKPLYLAGPMTGIPQFNFPLFEVVARELRARGHLITSPHENDTPAVQAAAWASPDGKLDANGKIAGETWGDILARDVKLIADGVSGVVLLDNWHKSRGARLEAFVALLCGLPLHYFVDGVIFTAYRDDVMDAINRNTVGAA
jgi:hypothetical protein